MQGFETDLVRLSDVDICIKRIYKKPVRRDGYRILVDRLWPRGIKKESAALDEWLRDIAPTTELREWFAHEPGRWSAFRDRYLTEIGTQSNAGFVTAFRCTAMVYLARTTRATSASGITA